MRMETQSEAPRGGRVIVGSLILAAGVALLIFQATGADFAFSELWPLIVIGVGLTRFVDNGDRSRRGSGLVVMVVGCWLLINTLGLFGLTYGDSWPLLLILLGLARLLSADGAGFGLVLIAVGAWFLARNLDLWHGELDRAWPVLIILVGFSIVWKALTANRHPRHEEVNDDLAR